MKSRNPDNIIQQMNEYERRMTRIESAIREIGSVLAPEVTSLPTSPIDGHEVLFIADESVGVKWKLRYDADQPSGKQWVYVGGPPLRASVTASSTITSSSFATAPGSAGPTITLPGVGGDFDVEFGAGFVHYFASSNDAGHSGQMGINPGFSAGDFINIYVEQDEDSVNTEIDQYPSMRIRKTGLSVSQVLTAYFAKPNAFGTETFQVYDRWMCVTPVRIG